MSHEINKPSLKTWYIAYPDDEAFYHHGVTETNQLTTIGPENVEEFTNEEEYKTRCLELGIIIEETE